MSQNTHNIEQLNSLYDTAERVDQELFSEGRSNLLLVSGQHYTKRTSKFFARLRNTNRLSDVQKLRVTKNHIHKIVSHYVTSILSKAPGVVPKPKNESEMQDRKAAELNHAVWKDACDKHRMKEKIRMWAHNFVELGEICTFIYFDPNAGELQGYEPMMDDFGDEMKDEYDELIPDKGRPVFTGEFVFETFPMFDVLRSPYAKSMKESDHIILRKMVSKKELKRKYAHDPDKKKAIEDSEKETYVVFDSSKAHYDSSESEILVRYHVFRPCYKYPEGYFFISTPHGVLEEGPLPFGIFPVVWQGFDTYTTTPRAHSIIKVARPYQAEINRASSQLATHQITVGDDKVIYQSGTKLAPGALLPGVRGLTYQGSPPTILPGREGSQFLPYIEQQINEMYRACNMEEVNMDSQHNLDPYTLLFRSASQKQKFSGYIEKFERFLMDVCELYLRLAREYLPDDAVIAAVGKNEAINIAEFKSTTPLNYQIVLEAQTEDVDTKLGRQLSLNHILQYVGPQLGKDDIGKILKNMPYVNNDEIFNDLTIDHENVENDMLAIERGEQVGVDPYANNDYYIKRLTHRMKQADFKFLHPQVQQGYQMLLQQHQSEVVMKQEKIKAAQNEFIPIGGAMITCDMYIPKGDDPSKAQRVRLPYQALDWLVKRLDEQGMSLEKLEGMNQGAVAEMADMLLQSQQGPAMLGAPQPAMPAF